MRGFFCPYCSSTKTVPIVCNDKIEPKNSSYSKMCNKNRLEKKDAILGNWNFHYSKNYDGSVVKMNTYDRYCRKCQKPYYSIPSLLISDIRDLIFIIELSDNERWKYEIHFDDTNSYYNIDHNYFTKEYNSVLTPARKRKLLEGLDYSGFLDWKVLDDDKKTDYNIKWNVYVTFYNEQTYFRGGCDDYPDGWDNFIEPFIRVFKNDIFKKMRGSKN